MRDGRMLCNVNTICVRYLICAPQRKDNRIDHIVYYMAAMVFARVHYLSIFMNVDE